VIVTPTPGTTRDVIEEAINLNGLPVVLWDTAGIRETNDQIEKMGVALSRQYLEKADALIVVLDGSTVLTEEDDALLLSVREKKRLIALNKNDLPQKLETTELYDQKAVVTSVSAKSGAGVESLREALRSLLLGCSIEPSVMVTNVRHWSKLNRSEQALGRGALALTDGFPPEFIAIDLYDAREALEEIIGMVGSDDILERIFSEFCIGK
jgi:tRNA modification GTPase